ncbi:hypothetical protein N836_18730 [Leptolyngbya sp. Heron Island J]|uniref:glycosyltransferase n=1 Tax=Leptolyngbya sp. Heron Island J TaxID=1385935 RepID=UPI0003B9A1CF|nr:glycosyltransferase [Leptolyngbya sp. Heron Island J]ESA34026.1 hypothetical protein N836_18730 [Leptolyngbya sp. Heron Island J]
MTRPNIVPTARSNIVSRAKPKIVFYLPQPFWPTTWPKHVNDNWPGFRLDIYAWTLQTYLRLKETGFACELSQHIPDEGIVLFHSNVLQGASLKPGPRQLFICLKSEAHPHVHAQLHVVQNPVEASHCRVFMPHWPQSGLLPRDAERQDRFETVAFVGHPNSLDPEFQSPIWQERLVQLGLQWRPVCSGENGAESVDNRWHDYRDIDVIVAVRSFDPRMHWQTQNFCNKPATKLYNAWLAGVPAILGRDSAYWAERESSLDYLEVNSLSQVLEQLVRLRDNSNLRQAMVAHGYQRAQAYTPQAITQRWVDFLNRVAMPAYEYWCQQPELRKNIGLLRSQALKLQTGSQRTANQRLRQRITNLSSLLDAVVANGRS